jgi:chromosomal replication initiator protein
MSSLTIWDQVLTRIEDQVGKHSFSTWFKPTSLLADGGQNLSIRVPNLLFVEWLPKHYSVVLAEALRDVGRPDVKLTFVPDPAGSRESGKRSVSTTSPEFDRGQVDAGTTPPQEAEEIVADLAPQRAGSLIPRYTFDTFIVGPSNQFAHAACRAVAETPSRSYNPLFIHGGVGLGKTHLMHAIGHYVVQHHPGLVLTYISSERFMNEMINALRFDRILDFRSRYRSVDVLLVDDIQFVSGKEGTQN